MTINQHCGFCQVTDYVYENDVSLRTSVATLSLTLDVSSNSFSTELALDKYLYTYIIVIKHLNKQNHYIISMIKLYISVIVLLFLLFFQKSNSPRGLQVFV